MAVLIGILIVLIIPIWILRTIFGDMAKGLELLTRGLNKATEKVEAFNERQRIERANARTLQIEEENEQQAEWVKRAILPHQTASAEQSATSRPAASPKTSAPVFGKRT